MWVLTTTQWFQDLPWTRQSSCSFIYFLQPATSAVSKSSWCPPADWSVKSMAEETPGDASIEEAPLTAGFRPRAHLSYSQTRLRGPFQIAIFQSGGVRLSSVQLWMRSHRGKWREGGIFPCRLWGPAHTCWLLIAVSGSFRLPGAPLMTWCIIHPLPVPASQVKAVIHANIHL